jgi:hypothetical protein
MSWLRFVIRSLLGHTRYHDQAVEVNNRVLRAGLLRREALKMRLDVLERRGTQR